MNLSLYNRTIQTWWLILLWATVQLSPPFVLLQSVPFRDVNAILLLDIPSGYRTVSLGFLISWVSRVVMQQLSKTKREGGILLCLKFKDCAFFTGCCCSCFWLEWQFRYKTTEFFSDFCNERDKLML